MSNFEKKRQQHQNWPLPTKSFSEAVVLLNKTVFGFELKAVGSGKKVAEAQGIAVNKVYTLSMFLSE